MEDNGADILVSRKDKNVHRKKKVDHDFLILFLKNILVVSTHANFFFL